MTILDELFVYSILLFLLDCPQLLDSRELSFEITELATIMRCF